jgi:hypothetical protein
VIWAETRGGQSLSGRLPAKPFFRRGIEAVIGLGLSGKDRNWTTPGDPTTEWEQWQQTAPCGWRAASFSQIPVCLAGLFAARGRKTAGIGPFFRGSWCGEVADLSKSAQFRSLRKDGEMAIIHPLLARYWLSPQNHVAFWAETRF